VESGRECESKTWTTPHSQPPGLGCIVSLCHTEIVAILAAISIPRWRTFSGHLGIRRQMHTNPNVQNSLGKNKVFYVSYLMGVLIFTGEPKITTLIVAM
jgi:uncharacterized membrane protein YkgB